MVWISAVLFLSGLVFLTTTEASESTGHAVDMGFPEDSKALLDFLLKYASCSGDNCAYISEVEPQHSTTTEQPSVTEHATSIDEQNVKIPTDLSYCVDFMKKKEIFEANHPELMPLKLKLLSYLEQLSLDQTSNSVEKKEHLIKFLNYIIEISEKLIIVIKEKELKKPVPTEIPVYPTEEIIAEEIDHPTVITEGIFKEELDQPSFVGSVRGIPGVHYPNYTEVPITSFSCSDKKYVPGFYADLETHCQVFHVCYEHRRESFLCPVGTTFNQPILACDYWYSSNCSLSSHYYDVNAKKYEPEEVFDKTEENISQIITTIIAEEKPILPQIHVKSKETEILKSGLESILKFLPVKAKIVEFPVKPKVVAPIVKPIIKPKLVKAAVPVVKAKLAAVPFVKAKVAAAALPVVKAKVAAAAVPIVKAKVAAVPIVKSKVAAAVPILKTKIVAKPVVKAKVAAAAAVPIVKAKVASLPVVKAKIASAATVPVLKAKAASVAASSAALKAKTAAKLIPVKVASSKPKLILAPLKAKAIVKGKSAMISPLTKKALALGYMKLLKAKKLALMG